FAPSRTNTLHDALPMPEPAPVITATLPSNVPIGVAPFLPGAVERDVKLTSSHYDTNIVRLPDAAAAGRIAPHCVARSSHGGADQGPDRDRGDRPDAVRQGH